MLTYMSGYLRNKPTARLPVRRSAMSVRPILFLSGIVFMTDFGPRYYFVVRADMSGLIIGVRIGFQYLS